MKKYEKDMEDGEESSNKMHEGNRKMRRKKCKK